MRSDVKGNAHRLACTLRQLSEDERTIRELAKLLHYYPEQLQEDMEAVDQYINQLEKRLEETENNN